MVPRILLKPSGPQLQIPDHTPIEVQSIAAITGALMELRTHHPVNGSWILIPADDMPFDDLVSAIDAARAAEFPRFTLAAGPA